MARHGKGLIATKQLTHVCAALRKEYDLNLVFIFCPGFRCVTIWQTNDYSPVVAVDPWACETRHCLPIMDLTAVQKRICIAVCPQCHVVIVTDEDKSCPFPWSPYIHSATFGSAFKAGSGRSSVATTFWVGLALVKAQTGVLLSILVSITIQYLNGSWSVPISDKWMDARIVCTSIYLFIASNILQSVIKTNK